jgi:hypothetical protein
MRGCGRASASWVLLALLGSQQRVSLAQKDIEVLK